ncbi:porin family protein [Lewinella sp. W8]|uniref:porin family protein n=1 Tax=Lewinella sp. W8 TaxID=2528208 RepID=UPI001067A323|nr:porin family protein [Lewinella sp. W8]MTB53196.1 outer membrane beta-barrel protein [Lewinella sp. W8]
MRLILVLFFLISFLGTANGQDSTTVINRLQFGFGGGQLAHQVDFTPAATVEPLEGITLGVNLRYFDNKLVGFQAELNFVQAGWREDLGEGFSSRYERKTQYLEVAMFTQFSFGNGMIQPMLQAGPYLSFPLSEQEQLPAELDPSVLPENSYYGLSLPFRPNYGLLAGLGLNLELKRLTLQIQGRYLLGFNDLIKTGTTVAAISRRQGYGGHAAFLFDF